jgi:hypothetical protein
MKKVRQTDGGDPRCPGGRCREAAAGRHQRRATVVTVIRCTLSVDHRAIGGNLAARWLAAFTTRLENPLGMIARPWAFT